MGRAFIVGIGLLLTLGCSGDEGPSDEDLIEQFIEQVTGDVDQGYPERALSYVDMSAYPLDVRVPRHSGVYDAARAPEIEKAFRSVIAQRFTGTQLKLRSDKVEIDGDRAEVKLGLMTAVGPLRAEISLQKPTPGVWKVSRVHITQ